MYKRQASGAGLPCVVHPLIAGIIIAVISNADILLTRIFHILRLLLCNSPLSVRATSAPCNMPKQSAAKYFLRLYIKTYPCRHWCTRNRCYEVLRDAFHIHTSGRYRERFCFSLFRQFIHLLFSFCPPFRCFFF